MLLPAVRPGAGVPCSFTAAELRMSTSSTLLSSVSASSAFAGDVPFAAPLPPSSPCSCKGPKLR